MEYSSAVPGGNAYLSLPAPLEGETVAQGHLCDAQAITQAVTHKYPGADPATVEQEVQKLSYRFGCGASPEPAPASFAIRASPTSQPRTLPSASTSSPDEIPIE